MAKYVDMLPPQVKAEMRRDLYRILCGSYGNYEIQYLIEDVAMCSKVVDILGSEDDGMLSYEKYARWA